MIQQIFFPSLGHVEVRQAPPPPPPGNGEVSLAPAFVGICGTDVHVLHGKHSVKPPLVIGHEMAGIVEKIGAGVDGFVPGDHVALNPVVACSECTACLRGRYNICEKATIIGFRLPGAAQTKLVVKQKQLHHVPPTIPLHHAALAEPLSVGVHAVSRASDLEEVLIIGGGTIGLCVLAAAKAAGAARVTVVEPVPSKRALALHLGATAALSPDEPVAERFFSTCFDIVGRPATLGLAEGSCMSGGVIVVVGTAFGFSEVNTPRLQRYELTLLGSSIFVDDDMRQAIGILASGLFDAEAFITGQRSLDEAFQAYADASDPANVKTMIRMGNN